MNRTLIAVLLPVACSLSGHSAIAQQVPDPFAASRLARAHGRFGMLLRQFRAEEPNLPDHREAGLKPVIANYKGESNIPAGYWVWQRPYWFVFRDGPETWSPPRPWGPNAACGIPDTPEAGDRWSAWTSKEPDGKDEWLLLEYAAPVRAVSIEVHESFHPGAVRSIAILTPQGDELELWRNHELKAPVEDHRVLGIDLPLGFEFERVKLYFANDAIPGRNEIDAVGLHDDKGRVHWALRATASSTAGPGEEVVPILIEEGPIGPRCSWQVLRSVPLDQQVMIPGVNLSGSRGTTVLEDGRQLVPVPLFGAINNDPRRR